VMHQARWIALADEEAVLAERSKQSGLREKASPKRDRKPGLPDLREI
jgi:hypothetical protein